MALLTRPSQWTVPNPRGREVVEYGGAILSGDEGFSVKLLIIGEQDEFLSLKLIVVMD